MIEYGKMTSDRETGWHDSGYKKNISSLRERAVIRSAKTTGERGNLHHLAQLLQ